MPKRHGLCRIGTDSRRRDEKKRYLGTVRIGTALAVENGADNDLGDKIMHLPIGTIVPGTVKTEDRFEALLCSMAELARDSGNETLGELMNRFARLWESREADGSDASDHFDTLCELAEGNIPPYTYLGTLEGDGADFGVWPSIESLEEDAASEDAVIGLGKHESIPDYFMQVNDHGNVTLYRVSVEEVWSIV